MNDLVKIVGASAVAFTAGLYIGQDLDLQEAENMSRVEDGSDSKIPVTRTASFIKPFTAIAAAGIDYFANAMLAEKTNTAESIIVGGAAYLGVAVGKKVASKLRNGRSIPDSKIKQLSCIAQEMQTLLIDEDPFYEKLDQFFMDEVHDSRLRYRSDDTIKELSELENYVSSFKFNFHAVKSFYERPFKGIEKYMIHKDADTSFKIFIIDTEKNGTSSLYQLSQTQELFNIVLKDLFSENKSKLMDLYIAQSEKISWDNSLKSLYTHVQEELNHHSVCLMKRDERK